MKKIIISGVILVLLISIGFICSKCISKEEKNVIDTNKENVNKKVFKEPQEITYEIKGKEKYKLTKNDEEFSIILEKLNEALIAGYTSKEAAYDKGYYVKLAIMNIEKDIYSKNSVLRLHYSDTYEIDIIFEKNSVLDIIYIENGATYCFYGFDNKLQDEIKEYVDNI
jgi:hypothetical protein